jgi:tRNA pseudouridine65 synthase
MNIPICYEDDYIIVVSKPCNVLVHHSHMARNMDDEATLIDLLKAQYNHKYYPLHRLDRKTSGLILLVKKRADVTTFQELFLQNKIQKTYYALVRGFAPEKGLIESPVKGRDANVYKDAETHFFKLKEIALDIAVHPYDSSRYCLLKLKPKTGRLHQLRIHLNKISHPIIGDPKYGDRFHNRMFETEFNCSNMFLHAGEIEFMHPFSKKSICVHSEFPNHWTEAFNRFNWFLD